MNPALVVADTGREMKGDWLVGCHGGALGGGGCLPVPAFLVLGQGGLQQIAIDILRDRAAHATTKSNQRKLRRLCLVPFLFQIVLNVDNHSTRTTTRGARG